jgi:Ni/Co efflux regulator RcnB
MNSESWYRLGERFVLLCVAVGLVAIVVLI